MKEVYIAAASALPVQAQYPGTFLQLGGRALANCMGGISDLKPTGLFVGNMLGGLLDRQTQVGAALAEHVGMKGVEAYSIDAACAAGSAAFRAGCSAIRGGAHRIVAVCGVEKMSTGAREDTISALATASNWRSEGARGETFVSLNERLQRAYIDRYRLSSNAFAPFSILAHRNACENPHARFQRAIDTTTYQNDKQVHGTMRRYDAAPICDGAASILLVDKEAAMSLQRAGHPTVRVAGGACATDTLGLSERHDPLDLRALGQATARALEEARLTRDEIDLLEPHDAFTIMTALSLESSEFVPKGRATYLTDEFQPGGRIPIATMGGLKARGHPVGATGVYQLVEAYLQVAGLAGRAQVKGARIAMTQNLGGTGATAIVHIIARE